MLNALLHSLRHLGIEYFVTDGPRSIDWRVQLPENVDVALGVHVDALHTRSTGRESRVQPNKS